MFCPNCKSLLKPDGENLRCSNCDFTRPVDDRKPTTQIEKLEEELKEVPVFEELDTLPVDDSVRCPKCGNAGAYWHMRQTRAADEATTRFYQCTECRHRWREYA